MKVIHLNQKNNEPEGGLEKAIFFEQKGDLRLAEAAYKKYIKEFPTREYAYQRLMILYRKQKKYKEELAIIRAGIKAFEGLYKSSLRVTTTNKIAQLSRALQKSTGLADRKGKQLYNREPIGTWIKRKSIVEMKLKQ